VFVDRERKKTSKNVYHCSLTIAMSDQRMMTTTTTLDIVFCLDCSGSIMSYMNQIRAIISSMLRRVPQYGQGNIRLALIEFRSDRVHPTTRIHQFTPSVEIFREWLENVTIEGGCVDDSKAIGKEKHLSLRSSDFD
jgi:Mg-chelatase subunit ChlD